MSIYLIKRMIKFYFQKIKLLRLLKKWEFQLLENKEMQIETKTKVLEFINKIRKIKFQKRIIITQPFHK